MIRVKQDAARAAAAQTVRLLKKTAKAAKGRTRDLKEQWKAARKLSRQARKEARDAERALAAAVRARPRISARTAATKITPAWVAAPTGSIRRAPRKAVLRPIAASAPRAVIPAVSETLDRTDELLSPEADA
jgi:hypothetical protein